MGVDWAQFRQWVARERPPARQPELRPGVQFFMRAMEIANQVDPPEIDCPTLLHHILKDPILKPMFWAQGVTPPGARPPGFAMARNYDHDRVKPLHIFADGFQEPRYLADFADLRKACDRLLRPLPQSGEDAEYTPAALKVLARAGRACLALGQAGTPMAVALEALRERDKQVLQAVQAARLDPLELQDQLVALAYGENLVGPWSVDGLFLKTPVAELGPLTRAQGDSYTTKAGTIVKLDGDERVVYVRGHTLAGPTGFLFGAASRMSDAERLLGYGRVNRWARMYDTWLHLIVDANALTSVAVKVAKGFVPPGGA
jgi:hypothetical protein